MEAGPGGIPAPRWSKGNHPVSLTAPLETLASMDRPFIISALFTLLCLLCPSWEVARKGVFAQHPEQHIAYMLSQASPQFRPF